jgi:hypothetical protein
MQHSNEAKELLGDYRKESVIVIQQMAGLHQDFIWGEVWRRRGGKGHQIHVRQELDRLTDWKRTH